MWDSSGLYSGFATTIASTLLKCGATFYGGSLCLVEGDESPV